MHAAHARTHKRTQSLLLLDRLLSSQPSASPLTLVLDSLAQSAQPLLRAMLARAKRGPASARARTVYVAFETPAPPAHADVFVAAGGGRGGNVREQVLAAVGRGGAEGGAQGRTVVVFDSVYEVLRAGTMKSGDVASYFSGLLGAAPAVALVLVCHVDVPSPVGAAQYLPSPVTLLQYLATTILTMHSLTHVLAKKAARDRSLVEPVFGLGGESDEVEGVLVGLGSNDPRGVVLEMEHRRKSGRSVGAWYFVPSADGSLVVGSSAMAEIGGGAMLLEDCPLYRTSVTKVEGEEVAEGNRNLEASFNLGLTEKQRADREAVVLPYFDAQREGGAAGPGEGGRILYDMGSEDDFDEEEDEI